MDNRKDIIDNRKDIIDNRNYIIPVDITAKTL